MPDDRPVALDEYPVHQVPLSMKHVATGDRNAYDRCIFHVFDHRGRMLLIVGLGVYPNLGVIDAYATLRDGNRLHAVRASDALGEDRMKLAVGPLRITVEEPLRRLRLQLDDETVPASPTGSLLGSSPGSVQRSPSDSPPDPGPESRPDPGPVSPPDSLAYDLTWTADFPALWEPHHIQRRGGRLTLEGRRFVQAGSVEGVIRVGGKETPVVAGEWTGTRDRSWGVRPVPGEEGGRLSEENPTEGFHWVWCPVRFEDRFLMVVIQEDADGHRTLNDATLVREGHRDLQLGWPQADISYRPGTRHPKSAVIHLTRPADRGPMELAMEVLTSSPLAVGAGYPPATDWQHGTWRGHAWTDRRVYDLSDPAAHPRAAYGVIDHAARFTLDGQVGHGIFEHGSFGRHDPSGFTGFDAVAD